MAARASSSFGMLTKQKPRERPVSWSVMMLTRSTVAVDAEKSPDVVFRRTI